MNSEILIALGTIVITPVVTVITLYIKDKNKLTEKSQTHEFEKENKLITVLQDDIIELKSQVKTLESRLDKKDAEIRELQRRLNSRELDYANLLKEHAELSQNHQNLQVEHDNLKKQYEETVERLTNLTTDHEALKKKSIESAKHMITPTDPVKISDEPANETKNNL
jgi:chromosome segregation ATPase